MKRSSLKSTKTVAKSTEEAIFSILIFNIQGKEYAFPVTCIQEIINYASYTELPLMSNSAHGVVSLRGTGVSVFDLYALLSTKSSENNKCSCIIILSLNDTHASDKKQILGVLVDSVSSVLEISLGQIEEAPHVGDKSRSSFFSGMIQVNGRFVLILNEKILFYRSQNVPLDPEKERA